MKISFTALPTSGGKIQVSFDGGLSFKDYNVADIRETGIPLKDNQDYEKIQIKSSNTVLKDFDVIRKIKLSDPDNEILSFDLTKSTSSKGCITNLKLPEGITTIDDSSFSECENLKSVTIPNSVTSIGSNAFHDCKSLTSITIPDSVTSIGSNAFSSCNSLTSLEIPDSVMEISLYSFCNCSNLTNVIIPGRNGVLCADSPFYGCKKLESVIIKDLGATVFGGVFRSCKNLKSVTIPDSITIIGELAFRDCTNLTSFTIPRNVSKVYEGAFNGCSGLKDIIVDNNNPYLIFDNGILYSKDKSELMVGIQQDDNIIIPDGVVKIYSYAFNNCKKPTSITIPNSVTWIGNNALQYPSIINYKGTEEQWKSIQKYAYNLSDNTQINYNYEG